MRIAIHSRSWSVRSGGGVLYVYALAAALAARHQVDLYYPKARDEAELEDILPPFAHRPQIRQRPPRARWRWWNELRRAAADLAYDQAIVQASFVPRFALQRRTTLLCEFPATPRLPLADRVRLGTFERIVANSHYTAGWIERRWGRTAQVLQPPVVGSLTALAKRPYILGVGRFANGGRSKRQLDLVAFFRQLHDAGLRGWELHLAGFPQEPAFVTAVREAAAGLPVHLHLGLGRSELERLFGHASIFWHAVGAGIDAERFPERMEHFGIVTVEAMQAGAVPVVVNRGGQPEIVGEDGEAGFLWDTPQQCVEQTWELTQDAAALARHGQQAQVRAEAFSLARFTARAQAIFAGENG